MIDAKNLKHLVEHELQAISDSRVRAHVRGLLVDPRPVLRDWDYGEPSQQYVCWTVVDDSPPSEVAIAYCEEGFGPRMPWGLVWSREDGSEYGSIGMDSGWYLTLQEAVYESVASALPIWRLYRRDNRGDVTLSEEMDWDVAWTRCAALRQADPTSRYDVDYTARDSRG